MSYYMKFVILLSSFIFAILTFLINREKLTKKYKMIIVKNRGLGEYVNTTLHTISTLCNKYECGKYLRGSNSSNNDKNVESFQNKVDVVYLWVNGTINKPKDTTGLKEVSTANRFREWNELKYSIELLRKNGKNVGNIYVITNGNRPQYDNMNGILFVDHSDFIPKKYLPTFSSYTIQFNLDRLLNKLSDPFLLLDDDFFITKKIDLVEYTKQNVFFVETWGHNWNENQPSNDHFVRAIQNSNNILKKVYKNFKQFGAIAHMPLTIRHKHFVKMKELIDTTVSMTPFRSKTSLQFQYTLAAVGKYSFNSQLKKAQGMYHFIMMNDIKKLKHSFQSVLTHRRNFLTLNDDIKEVTTHKKVINDFLKCLVKNDCVNNV